MTEQHNPLTCEFCHTDGIVAEIAEYERIIETLADFIEANVPGSQVYRENGLIVT